jgi:hypothetical protein
VKPFSFLLSAQLAAFGLPAGADPDHFHLIAPYEKDSRKLLCLPWIDRYSGRRYAVRTGPLSALTSGSTAYLNSYRDVFEQFETHPEAKSAAPDGADVRDRRGGY